jgi:hypothetical protein
MRVRRLTAIPLALAALSLGAASAVTEASAQTSQPPVSPTKLSRQAGARLIHRAKVLLGPATRAGARASAAVEGPSGDLTPVLLRLARALPSLPATQRRQVRRLLARPTDNPDPDGETYPQGAPIASDCSAHFCVHWVNDAGYPDAPDLADVSPADGIPDYVGEVEGVAENVYSTENGALGWRAPKPDGTLGGDPRIDIYLAEIGDSLFGYANTDPGQIGRKRHAYLVIDDDYAISQFPGTNPIEDIEVTLAHEYNHVLQFGYDTFQDIWFLEASATWMEDQVYGSVNDYVRYLKRWNRRTKIPITQDSIKIYGSAVWNHWLSHRYGQSIVRSAWEKALSVHPDAFSIGSYEAAIRAAGPSDFTLDFARFARDLAEWRTDTAFPEGDLYPDVQRQGSLPTNGAERHRILDHTTYRMLQVKPTAAKALRINAFERPGVAGAIAVVGRIGSQTGGTVVSDLALQRRGGFMTVRLSHPERFDRITVVLVNADAKINGFGKADWHYTGNKAGFAVSARLIR